MLTIEQQYVLELLRVAFELKQADEISEALDEDEVERMILHNGILLTVYPGLNPALQGRLFTLYAIRVSQALTQALEGKQIQEKLNKAGLESIGLKGWELQRLYPKPSMRQMADLDILVRPYCYEKIAILMKELEYSARGESSWMHDNFKKDVILVEMHKRLTDDSNKVRDWERRMWERISLGEDELLHMSLEDQTIFHVVHMYKDFMNGSLGLRRIVDTWLLHRQKMDLEVVTQELEAFGLKSFYNHMLHLGNVCMGEEELDEDTTLLLEHAFQYGIYGSRKTYQMGRIVKMSGGSLRWGKIKSLIAAVFLPVSRMKAQFPTLERYPVLLPYYWLKRIIPFLHGDVKKSLRTLDYSNLTEDDFEEMQRFFRAGGC